jgi:divalent metal cation (Fe/Co/Zn/Cd) transporter
MTGAFKDTITIKDLPYDRAVEVIVTYPDDMSITNVQELAEKAWRSVSKEITIGRVTVRVKPSA